MTKSLLEFYNDKDTKNNVQEYLVQFLKEEAVRLLMAKEEVKGVAEAKEYIDKAFDNMDTLFAPKSKSKKQKNEAR